VRGTNVGRRGFTDSESCVSRGCVCKCVAHENMKSVLKSLLLTTDSWGSFLKVSQRQGAARSEGGGPG
jgi:hypothetical protein